MMSDGMGADRGRSIGYGYRRRGRHAVRRAISSLALTAAALALALSGCATWAKWDYPAGWGSVATTPKQGDCPDLSGAYSNRAVADYPQGATEPQSLSAVFTAMGKAHDQTSAHRSDFQWLHGSWDPIEDAASVSLAQTPDSLTVTFVTIAGAKTVLTFRHLRSTWGGSAALLDQLDKYVCVRDPSQPSLGFFARTKLYRVNPNDGETLVFLLKAADGSLIAGAQASHVHVSTLNWLPIPLSVDPDQPIPHYSSSSVLYRFAPLTSEAGAASGTWSAPLTPTSRAELRRIVIPSDEGRANTYDKAIWLPDANVTSIETLMDAAHNAWRGAVVLTEKSLILQLHTDKGVASGLGLRIAYADIASVEIKRFGLHGVQRFVVVTRRNGQVDSFQFVHHVTIDQEQTEAVGTLLRSKLQDIPPAKASE